MTEPLHPPRVRSTAAPGAANHPIDAPLRETPAPPEFSQDLFDTIREPLLILDGGLRVHAANRAFYETFHVSAADTEHQLIYELGNGQWNIAALRTLLEDVVPASSVFNDFELEHDFPSIGRRVMLLNARKLRQGRHEELLVLAMEDVTDRRRGEGEIAKAKEAAETANRVKSLFLANMSHELRTPLNAILGYSDMLLEEVAEMNLPQFSADLAKISAAGKHLLGLINGILDLSKIEAGKMELHLERFEIADLIDEVASTIAIQARQNGNQLEIVCPAGIGFMVADLSKVRQGLFNLASNAAKFTNGGSIRIETERQVMDGADWIVFRVSDTGIGLTPDQIVRLFQPFTQADASTTRKFGGTGLGLSLTRRFCQIMSGDVMVHSAPGEGSVFTIKLPAIVPDPSLHETEERRRVPTILDLSGADDTYSLPAPGTCVLVVDDDPVQRDLMQRYLRKEGFIVRTASGGVEGLQLARQFVPAAITLDVMMPDLDGWSVLAALKADTGLCDVPVIMLTMVDDPVRGFALGAADYATKPVDRVRLSQLMKKHMSPDPPSPVLLVDDDKSVRAMTRAILEKDGWSVSEAANGAAALESMETQRPSLIFCDLIMPVMNGFEFAAAVRQHPEWSSIPIIIMTSQDITADDRRQLDGYVEAILQKQGASRESILQQVRDTLTNNHAPRLPPQNALSA